MKKSLSILLFTLMIFTGLNCSKSNSDLPNNQLNETLKEAMTLANVPCGSSNPEQSLQWLKDIIMKAEEDKATKKYLGNYLGKIFSTSYQNQSVFYVSMAMGSGGLAFYLFDCNGITVKISPNDIVTFSQNAQKGKLIYSNVPF